ncbi:MAG: DUF4251 domain-containing protein [Bacteroidales bacterium]|jgi:hypothetical protein
MKTIRTYLVSIFLVLGSFFIPFVAFSQNAKISRQEKKEAKKARMEANYIILDSLLNSRQFVLEADYLQNNNGETKPVESNLNFIRLTGSKGTLQTGSDFRMGNNGVGGVTTEGDIGYWHLTRNPKGHSYDLRFSLMTNMGHFDVFLTVNTDNNATATISGTTAGNLTWMGHLKTLNNSTVFKGSNALY